MIKVKHSNPMSRNSSQPTMVGTSIALLQERFRQLQEDKQRREKKELLNQLSDSSEIGASMMHLEPRNSATLRDRDSLTLCLNLQNVGKQAHGHEPRMVPSRATLWPGNAATVGASRNFDNPEVDTTLHL